MRSASRMSDSRARAQMVDELPCVRRQHLDVAHTDGEFSQSPGIGETYGADRHGSFGPSHRGFRNDADPDIAFNQPADGIETAQLDTQAQRSANSIGLVCEKALDRAGAVEADHVVVEHLGKADT